ncbi:MAG: hypothetical protein OHK0026_13450 [Rhodocyclaceae bacterium]
MILAAVLAGCAGLGSVEQAAAPQTLRGSDAASMDRAPEVKAYLGKRPGTQKPIPRTFTGQPPLIPHATSNFDEISLEENQCLSCHGLDVYKKKNAPKVGDAHLLPGGTQVSMGRYQCTTCHVPQVDARPLVENLFVGTPQNR